MPTMTDPEFAVMSSLTASGCPWLDTINGKPQVCVGRGKHEAVAKRTVAALLKKGWVALSPLHPDAFYATAAGRAATMEAAAPRLRRFLDTHGETATWDAVYHGLGIPYAQALERLGLLEINLTGGLTRCSVFLTPTGRAFLEGTAPTYKNFETEFRSFLDPEGYAREEAERQAEERAQLEENLRRAESERRQRVERAQADAVDQQRAEAQAQGLAAAERQVLELAKAACRQQASYDDLMAAVERLLALEAARGPA